MTRNRIRKHSEDDGNVLYLTVDDSHWDIYTYRKSSNRTHETYAFYFMIIIPQVKKEHKLKKIFFLILQSKYSLSGERNQQQTHN